MASSSSSSSQRGLRLSLHVLLLLPLCLTATSDSQDLIKKTCKATPYYSLCLSSLLTNPTISPSDTKSLAAIIITTASSNATSISTYLSSQLLSAGASSGQPIAVGPNQNPLKLCADKYSSAIDSLKSAMQDLNSEMYDYAAVDVSAAAAYPDACRNAFMRTPAAYPAELAKRERALKRMCAVAIAIINLLINQQN